MNKSSALNESILSLLRPGVVAVGGSRLLSPEGQRQLATVAAAVVASGRSLAVGCCVGADAAVISALSGSPNIHIYAAFGPEPDSPGSWVCSAVSTVSRAVAAGSPGSWWVGGRGHLPYKHRLAQRTLVVARLGVGGCLVGFGRFGPHKGSLLLASACACRGYPVVGLADGFAVADLPLLGKGRWFSLGYSAACWVSQSGL
jgi:hypothetical protein